LTLTWIAEEVEPLNWRAEIQVGNEDLHRCQRTLWGKLEYTPVKQSPGLFMLTKYKQDYIVTATPGYN
jgi:hypothetical protein